ncbi:MAG TPA: methyltransferase domain-containing protein [Gemmatimonadales bacterium]|nr:methyltransferase domain-containing protein [Gemmatimonadales bacterium]
MPAAAFDQLAPAYDARFTASDLGQILRRRVRRWLDQAFAPGQFVLELNCGTGEDALYLARRGVRVLATDASAEMLAVAASKIAGTTLSNAITRRQVALENLDELRQGYAGAFDGALSNFGGLNCVADLGALGQSLAALLAPGARAVLCVMGPIVPWEWAWFLAHGAVRTAFRRLAPDGVPWRDLVVRYPSIGDTRRGFAPHFRVRRAGGLGVFVPPTYAEPWAQRHPRLVEWLDRCERRVEQWPVVPWLGDHYLLELERR